MDPLADALRRELKALGPNSAMSETVAAWPDAVGAEIARNAWPARLGRDGTLRVHTRDSVWAFELGSRVDEIRQRLGDRAPARLVFAAGPLPEPAREHDDEERRSTPAPSREHEATAASLVRGIRDEDLRKIVAKTIAMSLAAVESGRSF